MLRRILRETLWIPYQNQVRGFDEGTGFQGSLGNNSEEIYFAKNSFEIKSLHRKSARSDITFRFPIHMYIYEKLVTISLQEF